MKDQVLLRRRICLQITTKKVCFVILSFAGLVVLAKSLNPIPFRTRPLNSSAPMVLWLKPWESRSLPGLQRTEQTSLRFRRFSAGEMAEQNAPLPSGGGVFVCVIACAIRAVYSRGPRHSARGASPVTDMPTPSAARTGMPARSKSSRQKTFTPKWSGADRLRWKV